MADPESVADPAFDRVLPDASHEGWRLHFFREAGERMVLFAEEEVLPEKVTDPRANRIVQSKRIWLTREEIVWMRDQCTALLAELDAEASPPAEAT